MSEAKPKYVASVPERKEFSDDTSEFDKIFFCHSIKFKGYTYTYNISYGITRIFNTVTQTILTHKQISPIYHSTFVMNTGSKNEQYQD